MGNSSPIITLQGIAVNDLLPLMAEAMKPIVAEAVRTLMQPPPDQLLSRQETAKLLDIDIATISRWTKKGKLIAYGMGNRVYFKRAEVMEALQRIN